MPEQQQGELLFGQFLMSLLASLAVGIVLYKLTKPPASPWVPTK